MDTQKQIIDRLKQANNVLVTVSNDPTVDQLAACLGFSLALTNLDKHAAAVFSGKVPSTIDFLNPSATFEPTTDSLRDFIISLDKSKADKLRYKVEDEVVRIFITPYRSSITDKDLQFSQGDFNVDVVLALGVHDQTQLDQAVTAHGRILHDATVITLNFQQATELGAINWLNESASGLAEMATEIISQLGKDVLDEQTSTALLTGIVAQTDRFSNDKTSAQTMKLSAALMAAGANQQLVATKLEEPEQPIENTESEDSIAQTDSSSPDEILEEEQLSQVAVSDDGTLEINHPKPHEEQIGVTPLPDSAIAPEPDTLSLPPIISDVPPAENAPTPGPVLPEESPLPEIKKDKRALLPSQERPNDEFNNSRPASVYDDEDKPALANPINNRILSHETASVPEVVAPPPSAEEKPAAPEPAIAPAQIFTPQPPQPIQSYQPAPVEPPVTPMRPQIVPDPLAMPTQTLEELERQLGSHEHEEANDELDLNTLARPDDLPQAPTQPATSLDAARDAVAQAMSGGISQNPEPISALNAQPLGQPLHESPQMPSTADQPVTMPLPSTYPPQVPPPITPMAPPAQAPPAVPPPIMPPFNQFPPQ